MASSRVDAELSKICNRLWEEDVNRAEPNKDYEIDLQGGWCTGRFSLTCSLLKLAI